MQPASRLRWNCTLGFIQNNNNNEKTTQNKISHLISSNVSYLTFYVVDFFFVVVHRNSNLKLELLNPHKEEDEKKHQKSIQSAYGD